MFFVDVNPSEVPQYEAVPSTSKAQFQEPAIPMSSKRKSVFRGIDDLSPSAATPRKQKLMHMVKKKTAKQKKVSKFKHT